MTTRYEDGKLVNVGDYVGFKDGIEQGGRVAAIKGDMIEIRMWDSDAGEEYFVMKQARRCWYEG